MYRHQLTSLEARQDAVMRTILDARSLAIPYLATEEYRQGFIASASQQRISGEPAAGAVRTSILAQARQRGRKLRAALAARFQSAPVAEMGTPAASTTASL
jgi:hypothetical protein